MWKPKPSFTKTYPNGQPKPFSPRRIALSRGVFAHNYIHTNLKRHDIQTDNVTLKSYVDLADAYAAIVSRHLLRTSPTKKKLDAIN